MLSPLVRAATGTVNSIGVFMHKGILALWLSILVFVAMISSEIIVTKITADNQNSSSSQ